MLDAGSNQISITHMATHTAAFLVICITIHIVKIF